MIDERPPPSTGSDSFDDPYAGVDRTVLPEWWREAIAEFEEHGLPPYQPPRFCDGAVKSEVVEHIEAEHGIVIDFVGIDTRFNDDWTIRIDGEPVGTIGHGRTSDRSPLYRMTSDEFVEFIENQVDD